MRHCRFLPREGAKRAGAATLKALSPDVHRLVWRVVSRPVSEDRRCRDGVQGWKKSDRGCGGRTRRDLWVRRRISIETRDLSGSQ